MHSRDCLEANEAVRVCFSSSGVGLVRVVQPPTNDSVFVLRIGGPHPQTALIERSSSLGSAVWAAPFRLCRPGPYTVHCGYSLTTNPAIKKPPKAGRALAVEDIAADGSRTTRMRASGAIASAATHGAHHTQRVCASPTARPGRSRARRPSRRGSSAPPSNARAVAP